MQPIGLLIEFKDGRVKEANFGMATAARAENRQLVALVVDASAGDAKASLEAYGVARIINITTGNRRLGSCRPGRRGGGRHASNLRSPA